MNPYRKNKYKLCKIRLASVQSHFIYYSCSPAGPAHWCHSTNELGDSLTKRRLCTNLSRRTESQLPASQLLGDLHEHVNHPRVIILKIAQLITRSQCTRQNQIELERSRATPAKLKRGGAKPAKIGQNKSCKLSR